VRQYVEQNVEEGMTLKIFLNTDAEAAFILYDDDGVSFDYEQGRFSLRELHAVFRDGVLTVDYPREVHVETLQAHVSAKPNSLILQGEDTPFTWDDDTASLVSGNV
jgi:hypothetical protein